jgi:D-amino-acid dehydrogenase
MQQGADGFTHDLIVLGAGIVGVSTARFAQMRGMRVALVDRRGPGEETSYGNSGIIDPGALFPKPMPRSLAGLARFARNDRVAARYRAGSLPGLAPFLLRYWRASRIEHVEASAWALRPLHAAARDAHRELARLSGAEHLFRQTGWLEIYRSAASLAAEAKRLALSRELGLDNRRLTREETLELEPHLKPVFAGAIWCAGADTVSDPGGVTRAHAARFAADGGLVARGDALALEAAPGRFALATGSGRIAAPKVVVALGIWSAAIARAQGCTVPLAAKRGYHRHYAPRGNAMLSRQICDEDVGYCLCPMTQGTRLTTGVEFAAAEAPPNPVQVDAARAAAADLFDLGEPVEAEPWMGRRPATPDMRPVIGEAPRMKGMWFAFGHGHWGFSQGPATGRAVAAALAGADPGLDLAPFRPDRPLP